MCFVTPEMIFFPQDAVHDELISAEEVISSGRMIQDDWDECSRLAHDLFLFGQKASACKKIKTLLETCIYVVCYAISELRYSYYL